MTRSKKALLNMTVSVVLEIVTAISSFILPRLILRYFGSNYNGLSSSIAQFISCIALLKSGIGSVTRASLYKPLADGDTEKISGIINATEIFMRRIAGIFLLGLLGVSIVYPFFVIDEFSWFFSFTFVLILGISTFAQYYFGITYQMLLQADQRQYVVNAIEIGTVILNTTLGVVLIISGFNIRIVKLGSALAFSLQPLLLRFFVRKNYCINKRVAPDNKAISQRWDAFGHQLASFIHTNTDIVVLTVLTNVREISVYSMYCLVAHAIKKAIHALTTGISAAFGNMIAKDESEKLYNYFSVFDTIVFFIALVLFSCVAVLIVPFMEIYTSGVKDVNYLRLGFGCLVAMAEFLFCMKMPLQILIQAYGHFKQTKKGGYIEACLNIISSVILVYFFGLNGVMVGTILSIVYRIIDYIIYSEKELLKYGYLYYLKKVMVLFIFCSVIGVTIVVIPINTLTVFQWIVRAFIIFLCYSFLAGILFKLFYLEQFEYSLIFIKSKLRKSR